MNKMYQLSIAGTPLNNDENNPVTLYCTNKEGQATKDGFIVELGTTHAVGTIENQAFGFFEISENTYVLGSYTDGLVLSFYESEDVLRFIWSEISDSTVSFEPVIGDNGKIALIRDPQGAGFTVYDGKNLNR